MFMAQFGVDNTLCIRGPRFTQKAGLTCFHWVCRWYCRLLSFSPFSQKHTVEGWKQHSSIPLVNPSCVILPKLSRSSGIDLWVCPHWMHTRKVTNVGIMNKSICIKFTFSPVLGLVTAASEHRDRWMLDNVFVLVCLDESLLCLEISQQMRVCSSNKPWTLHDGYQRVNLSDGFCWWRVGVLPIPLLIGIASQLRACQLTLLSQDLVAHQPHHYSHLYKGDHTKRNWKNADDQVGLHNKCEIFG